MPLMAIVLRYLRNAWGAAQKCVMHRADSFLLAGNYGDEAIKDDKTY